jgi:hypothetical protein
MKSLIIIAIILFVAAGVYVINLPPREMTIRDLHPVIGPSVTQEVIGLPDTSSADSIETPVVPVSADNSFDEHQAKPAALIEGNSLIEYYIIIESVGNYVKAEEKAEKLKMLYNADIIVLPPTAEGRFRLSYGKYSSSEEAKSVIKSVRTKICPDAWMYSAAPAVRFTGK